MTQPNNRGRIALAPRTYQIEAALLRLHGEAVDVLWLEVARNSRPNPDSNLLV